jgi:RNA polymerase sigma-70 factor, ECF subfamily
VEDGQFAVLFERYHRHVVAWACKMLGNYETAKDVGQEAFVKAWSAVDGFRGQSRFTTWLYAITRNTCHDYLRARAVRPLEVDERAIDAAPPTVENDALRRLEAEHAAIVVGRLMQTSGLNETERQAFTLHYGYDVPVQHVTARLGMTNPSGARARILSATRKLRRSAKRWQRLEARNA